MRQRGDICPHIPTTSMKRFQFARFVVIGLAPCFQVQLPAVAAYRHLHDLGSAFVDRGDAHVAADLFDQIFVGVAVTAEGLNAGVGSLVPCFGGHVLCDRAFGVETAFSGVDALGGLLDVGAGGFESSHVGHDQFVGI